MAELRERTFPSSSERSHRSLGLWVVVIALLVFSLSPALTRSHVEGFTYLTETMSLLFPAISMADPLWEVGHSYFYLARPGAIWLMAPLSHFAPGQGYDLLMWVMMPVFLVGLVILTRRWSGASWLACVATLLFLPIALEAQFFHNDNVVAVGFSIWGLILLRPSCRLTTVFGAGCLLALGVLCRLDQILLMPLFTVLAVLDTPSPTTVLKRIAAGLAGFVFVHGLAAVIDPQAANLLLRMQTISAADALWARKGLPWNLVLDLDLASALLAMGTGLFAIFFGAQVMNERVAAERQASWLSFNRALPLLLLTYPLAIYALTFGKYYDPRAFLTIIPLIAPMVAVALDRYVFGALQARSAGQPTEVRANLPAAVLIVMPLVLPGVPTFADLGRVPYETENAVPSLTGRIWYRDHWLGWQDRFRQDETRVHAMLSSAEDDAEPKVYMSTSWNLDRTTQWSLAVAGYRMVPSTRAACAGYGVQWQGDNGQSAYHLRLHVPFLHNIHAQTSAAFVTHGETCLQAFEEAHRYAVDQPAPYISPSPLQVTIQPDENGVYPLTDESIAALSDAAQETLATFATDTRKTSAQVAEGYIKSTEETLNGFRSK